MTKYNDYISANLPAMNLEKTQNFYQQLGFECQYQSDQWMILNKENLTLEFFAHPQLDSKNSWHSACIRVKDLEKLHAEWKKLDWVSFDHAKITEIENTAEVDIFYLIDINGNLLRCIRRDDIAV